MQLTTCLHEKRLTNVLPNLKKSFKSLVYLSQSDRLENLCFGIRLLIVKGWGEQVNLLDLRSLRYFVSKRCCRIISTLRTV